METHISLILGLVSSKLQDQTAFYAAFYDQRSSRGSILITRLVAVIVLAAKTKHTTGQAKIVLPRSRAVVLLGCALQFSPHSHKGLRVSDDAAFCKPKPPE